MIKLGQTIHHIRDPTCTPGEDSPQNKAKKGRGKSNVCPHCGKDIDEIPGTSSNK